MLFNGASEDLLAYSNGHERMGVGVYGEKTSKFVTLTGRVWGEQTDGPEDPDGARRA